MDSAQSVPPDTPPMAARVSDLHAAALAEHASNPDVVYTHLQDRHYDKTSVSMVFVLQLMPWAEARLVAGDPVKNARAILRYALPIQNTSARRIQVGGTQESPCQEMNRGL